MLVQDGDFWGFYYKYIYIYTNLKQKSPGRAEKVVVHTALAPPSLAPLEKSIWLISLLSEIQNLPHQDKSKYFIYNAFWSKNINVLSHIMLNHGLSLSFIYSKGSRLTCLNNRETWPQRIKLWKSRYWNIGMFFS